MSRLRRGDPSRLTTTIKMDKDLSYHLRDLGLPGSSGEDIIYTIMKVLAKYPKVKDEIKETLPR